VECTDEEVRNKILPYRSDKDFLDAIERKIGYCKVNPNENERIYTNFFLVSVDMKNIQSFGWVYPYSDQWNAYNPFSEIEVLNFDELEELKNHQHLFED